MLKFDHSWKCTLNYLPLYLYFSQEYLPNVHFAHVASELGKEHKCASHQFGSAGELFLCTTKQVYETITLTTRNNGRAYKLHVTGWRIQQELQLEPHYWCRYVHNFVQ